MLLSIHHLLAVDLLSQCQKFHKVSAAKVVRKISKMVPSTESSSPLHYITESVSVWTNRVPTCRISMGSFSWAKDVVKILMYSLLILFGATQWAFSEYVKSTHIPFSTMRRSFQSKWVLNTIFLISSYVWQYFFCWNRARITNSTKEQVRN